MEYLSDVYMFQVTARGTDGVGLTMGFTLPREPYDRLMNTHNFPLPPVNRTPVHLTDTEFYRISEIIAQDADLLRR